MIMFSKRMSPLESRGKVAKLRFQSNQVLNDITSAHVMFSIIIWVVIRAQVTLKVMTKEIPSQVFLIRDMYNVEYVRAQSLMIIYSLELLSVPLAGEELISKEKLKPQDYKTLKKMELRISKLDDGTDPSTALSRAVSIARICFKQFSKASYHTALMTTLKHLKIIINDRIRGTMKYNNKQSFLKKYPVFKDRDPIEQEKLWHTANWMNLLFKIINAKNNKGLALTVVSKFLGNVIQNA